MSQKRKQKQIFSIVHGKRATEATYKIALILGKGEKPYSDIETLKACLIDSVSCMDPDKVDKYKQPPLSRRTTTERQHEHSTNSSEQLISICQMEDAYYSIALDESTDVTDSAEILLFVWVITADFKSYEELFTLATLKGKTRGCDIFAAFKEKICLAQLQLKKIVSICSDGAHSMRGKNEGFIAFLKNKLPDPDCLITFHCILHQQSLCAKAATLDDTLKKVIGVVNYMQANSSRHRQFRNLLQSDDETYSEDLPYYSKVCWLSQGLVLQKLLELRKQIEKFFTSQKEICKLSNPKFCRDAAFLCDLMAKHNMLNSSLQGKVSL
ncbi:protein FAM200C-like [Hydra vulgaris]|uniref:Protein FAM200C-like n=1 Tax=Hydra vulgaris TaxID=6087 RepID=A0ABM4CRA8_HYDVU